MINLFTITSGSFYDLLDGYNKDDKGLAAAAGRRLTSFGKNINSIIVNIIDVSLAPTSDNVYRLRLLCNSDGRSVAGDGEVSMFASQIPTPTPSPTPTPAPTSKWPITAGTTGAESEIRYAQHKLKQLFYIDSDPNGQFDEVLQDALYEFYRQNGLKLVDGLSLEGYELLKSGEPGAHPTATPTPSPTPAPTKDPSIAIHPGDTGATVRNACYELEKLGYYVPHDQLTEDNDWYGKDMVLTSEQMDDAFRFAKVHSDAYGAESLAMLIALVKYENDQLVINADW